jgi:lipid A 3-O-deacylase
VTHLFISWSGIAFLMFADAASAKELRAGYMQTRGGPEQGAAALSLEWRNTPLWTFSGFAGAPEIGLGAGAVISAAGKTSFAFADAGVRLRLDERLFVEAAFGLAYNDGEHGRRAPPGRATLGCAWAFREAAAVGYAVRPDLSVILGLEHISNAHVCDRNRGLTLIGLKVGYRF